MTRGDIFMVNFGIPFGSEVGYKRPVINNPVRYLDEKIASLNKAILRKLETAIDYVLKD